MRTLIRGAAVVDGTETERYRADVLVAGDRIAVIGDGTRGAGADRTTDAGGLALTPGFIDMHAHSDLAVLLDPAHLAKISQGVTTELLGQDGLSYAPVDDAALAMLRRKIAGGNTDPGPEPAAGIPFVFVNGQLAIDDGRRTDETAGRALRRQPDGSVL